MIVLLLGHVENDEEAYHYALLQEPEKFLGPKYTTPKGYSKKEKVYFCFNCFNYFHREVTYKEHVAWCHLKSGQNHVYPDKGEFLKFEAHEKSNEVGYCVFYDFETRQVKPEKRCSCSNEAIQMTKELKEKVSSDDKDIEIKQAVGELLNDHDSKLSNRDVENAAIDKFMEMQDENDKIDPPHREHHRRITKKRKGEKQKDGDEKKKVRRITACSHKSAILTHQQAISYGLIMVNRSGKVVEEICYHGDDAVEHFIRSLLKLEKKYLEKMECAEMVMTNEAKELIANATDCHICGDELGYDRVIDHDHITGKILGVSHNKCNLNRKEPKKIVTFAHNFSGYDSHLIVKELGKFSEDIHYMKAIPINTEKFKMIRINNIVMADSTAFLSDSLDKLVKTLSASNHKFPILSQWKNKQNEICLLTRKGVYPYSFATSLEKLEKTKCLPAKEEFFNELSDEHVSELDYDHAKNVFTQFKCKNMLDYTLLYNMTDVYLLAEVVFDFRKWVMNEFQLDICHYMSLPMLSKDVMLKTTGVKIGLISDPEMVHVLQENIRGGLSFIGTRYANVKGKTIGKKNVLLYLDANNLYGKAMSFPMPLNDFEWMSKSEIKNYDPLKDASEENGVGYILEVTMRYPSHLHLEHNSFPLAPVAKEITDEDLSPYSKDCLNILRSNGKSSKKNIKYSATKLTSTFEDRKNYLCHGLNLKFYLEQGMELLEIHRGIKFYQSDFIRPYVEMCSEKRAQATSKSESDRCKLMSNSLYGKVRLIFII